MIRNGFNSNIALESAGIRGERWVNIKLQCGLTAAGSFAV